jgi:hypothetical protein
LEDGKFAHGLLRASAGAFPADGLTVTRAAIELEELDELEDEELEELEELEVLEVLEGGSDLLRKSSSGTNSDGSFLSGNSSISTPV